MTLASDALHDFLAPILPGWRIQYGRWDDDSRSDSYCVIKPAGGPRAELLRRPMFTIDLIGADGQSTQDVLIKANQIIESMRVNSGGLVSLQPGEPVFMPTSDRRAVFEIAVSAITV